MFKGLFSGMIRSSANQFARDGGKVLSNTIYGDAHSTPIRRVGAITTFSQNKQSLSETDQVEVTADEVRRACIESGMSLKIARTDIWQVVVIALLGVLPLVVTGVVCAPAFIFASLRRVWYFFTADAIYAKKTMVANRIPDHRYSQGYRIEGFRKGYEIVEIPATMRERSWHLLISILYGAIAAGIICLNVWLFEYIEEHPSPFETEQVSTIEKV